jgi:hypothetical protein
MNNQIATAIITTTTTAQPTGVILLELPLLGELLAAWLNSLCIVSPAAHR